jgi:hypothetical protein
MCPTLRRTDSIAPNNDRTKRLPCKVCEKREVKQVSTVFRHLVKLAPVFSISTRLFPAANSPSTRLNEEKTSRRRRKDALAVESSSASGAPDPLESKTQCPDSKNKDDIKTGFIVWKGEASEGREKGEGERTNNGVDRHENSDRATNTIPPYTPPQYKRFSGLRVSGTSPSLDFDSLILPVVLHLATLSLVDF